MKKLLGIAACILGILGSSGSIPVLAGTTNALVIDEMTRNQVAVNEFVAQNESMLHHDTYNSDVTSKLLPLGIYPEITSSRETVLLNSVSCFFYDDLNNCYTPYSVPVEGGMSQAGIAIRDVTHTPAETLGYYLPHEADPEEAYGIQNGYAYIDRLGCIVCPTNHGHVIMLKTVDQDGTVLPEFQKVLDVNVLKAAMETLGEDINPQLMSIIPDYEGNIWFATGGFRIDPAIAKDGFVGYLEREYVDRTLAGETVSYEDYIHCYRLGKGENTENGISSHETGCILLSNQNCYLLQASEAGVQICWKTPYESDGGTRPDPSPDAAIPGAGMAWGSGASPTLSEKFVFFTTNQAPIKLLALDIETGEVLAEHEIFEGIEDLSVSVENSILVYSGEPEQASVLVYNWFGAGSASLYTPEADSTIQLFSNLYDRTWIAKGSDSLMPGVQRLDTVRDGDGYKMESVWLREDLCSTCMFKLSTATGYVYGYTEIDGLWQFLVLDWDTGETVLSVPVSTQARYNNLGSGMMQGNDGNSLYVPTNNRELLCLHDRFAYLPEKPYVDLDILEQGRYLCDKAALKEAAGEQAEPVTPLHQFSADSILQPTILACRVNGLQGHAKDLRLFVQLPDGSYQEYPETWSLVKEGGASLEAEEELLPEEIYEVRFLIADGNEFDLCEETENVTAAMLLVK